MNQTFLRSFVGGLAEGAKRAFNAMAKEEHDTITAKRAFDNLRQEYEEHLRLVLEALTVLHPEDGKTFTFDVTERSDIPALYVSVSYGSHPCVASARPLSVEYAPLKRLRPTVQKAELCLSKNSMTITSTGNKKHSETMSVRTIRALSKRFGEWVGEVAPHQVAALGSRLSTSTYAPNRTRQP